MDRRVKHAADATFMPMSLAAQERDMMAAHLEDQLQEWKMKKILQEKYELNSIQLLVYQGQKLNSHMEKQLEEDVQVCILLCTFTSYKTLLLVYLFICPGRCSRRSWRRRRNLTKSWRPFCKKLRR